MNHEEFESRKVLKLKYKREDEIIDFLQNWFPPEIRSPLFNMKKFQGSEKNTPQSCRMH